jgi:teichuronic acid biosynthesis glycosyltransferase TuaG
MDVAAVITFHRDDAFFPDALASVLAQTRPPDEIIVVDDASPPGMAETLRDLDPRVRIVRHDVNRGAANARQTGTDASSAPLIAYLDADDIWLPDKLERQLADLEAHTHLAANHTGIVLFHRDGSERVFADKPRELGLAEALRTQHVLASALMIRRDVLRAVGGWSADRRLTGDWELSIRLVAGGHRIGFLAEPLVRLRRYDHAGQGGRSRSLMRGNLAMLRAHRALYWKTLGLRGTVAAYGDVIAGGGRHGGIDGRALRALGWVFGYRER